MTAHQQTAVQILRLVARTLAPERSFLWLAVVYGLGIGLLTLATPIAVQVLINTVAYTGLIAPLMVLSFVLFGLLCASGLLNALRVHLMEIFGRRLYARLVAEISLKSLYAKNPFFADEGRGPLFNRYFDIITVQKTVPVLVVGGFTILLQMAAGFLLTSFYHPLFLAFNVTLIVMIWLIWLFWGRVSILSAVELSQQKHKAAAWLEGLGASNGYFKSDRHIAYALDKTDEATADYVNAHKKHFRHHFSQTVSFLILYAFASAMLLGLGGLLVIREQLTLGQLVAAELVLSAAFFGMAQLGTYLMYFYDLCAASEELSLFDHVEQERPVAARELPRSESAALTFQRVRGDARGQPALFDLHIPGGTTVQAAADSHGVQRLFTNVLKRFETPIGGTAMLGDDDLLSLDHFTVRRQIIVLDRPSLIEMSIREYLSLARMNVTSSEMYKAISTVGLGPIIADLTEGLDTPLASTGWPLSTAETMQLKLAGALIARPRVLVLNQLFDLLPRDFLRAAIKALQTDFKTTVIVFTNRREDLGLDRYLFLERERQRLFEDHVAFHDAVMARRALTHAERDLEQEMQRKGEANHAIS